MSNKTTILILVAFFLSQIGYGQAVFTGGEGGGYNSLSVSSQTTIKSDEIEKTDFKVSVYPNPIIAYKEINASSKDFTIGKSLNFKIYDLLGNVIDNSDYQVTDQIISLNLPWQKMSKGMYLFVFSMDQKKTTVRVSMN